MKFINIDVEKNLSERLFSISPLVVQYHKLNNLLIIYAKLNVNLHFTYITVDIY